ncbi:hypothetical protein A9958_13300 (plasmid) [Staphylococcus simulans]|uniref:sporulation-delaying protein SdpB family protein n=1 Tax=Staphylococcus simulans TaxID=1286 RepID=UPI000D0A0124|nr:sporulation-delaying protein SdpB family protein [Staphylococcus simulans]AVO03406.1 hypothetical protein BI282_13295 [Staphylococcus simulans]AVO06331.1 hypothetical protein BI283_13085 [Staphylococcus simulans]AWG19954.1 hypothetical protein A9958_13300 [Staphylococcus simulans]AWI02838.1 hypothetical protein A7X73_12835 [Staphylococcus simulans]
MKIDKLINHWISMNPWTNVYGLSRSIIALSTFLTLAFNDISYLFKPASGMDDFPAKIILRFTLFSFGQNNYLTLAIIKYISIVILLLVIIGWRPRITAIPHWYITISLQNNLTIVDGGTQIASVITLLLIPIALFDKRKWHWERLEENSNDYGKIIAFTSINLIRIQIALLYLDSTVKKLAVKEWMDGTAVYYYINDPIVGFNHFFKSISHWFVESPLIVIPTWGTLLIQIILFLSLVVPKKYWRYILIAGIFMHEIFALLLGLVSFSITMTGVLILYLTPIEKNFNFSNFKNLFRKISRRIQ